MYTERITDLAAASANTPLSQLQHDDERPKFTERKPVEWYKPPGGAPCSGLYGGGSARKGYLF